MIPSVPCLRIDMPHGLSQGRAADDVVPERYFTRLT